MEYGAIEYGLLTLLIVIIVILFTKLMLSYKKLEDKQMELVDSCKIIDKERKHSQTILAHKDSAIESLEKCSKEVDILNSIKNVELTFQPISTNLLDGDLYIKEVATNKHVSNATVNIKVEKHHIKSAFIMRGGKKVNVLIYGKK